MLLGTTYTHKVIVPSKAAGSITDREKDCLFSGEHIILRRLQLLHGHGFNELDRIQARYTIIHDLIDRSVVALKNVRLSEIGDSTLKDVEMYSGYIILSYQYSALTDSHIRAYRNLVSFEAKKETEDSEPHRALLRLWAHDSLRNEIQNGRGLALNDNINWQIPREMSSNCLLQETGSLNISSLFP